MNFFKSLSLGVVSATALLLLNGCGQPEAPVADATPDAAVAAPAAIEPSQAAATKPAYPPRPLFGDTHLHTSYSMDAGAFGARLDMNDAYRFAKGEKIVSSTGVPAQLSRPLDFLVVADHSDNMGFFPELLSGDPDMLADPTGKQWYDDIQKGGQAAVGVATQVIARFSDNTFPEALASVPGSESYAAAWKDTIDAAESANDPGNFTAFIGWEWTSNDNGYNLHRVLIYKDAADKASMVEPYTTLPPAGSPNPVDLWNWMENYEAVSGGSILAIAHNGNLSNGNMFPLMESFFKDAIDENYAMARSKWEPLYEATQIKGDGETHPFLSPDDEFADYETWDMGNLTMSELKTEAMLDGEYARSGLQKGLLIEEAVGINPYKFGMIGGTDSHTALATADEANFFGKHSGVEPGPDRAHHNIACFGENCIRAVDMAASGYAAVWAHENTRESIFDAMMRKETYATTGPRMIVRFFGGWDYAAADVEGDLPANGYAKGVPMGGDFSGGADAAPKFLIAAMKDPDGANLDRVQVVKGWVANGERLEKVYDVAWSDDREPDAEGKVPAVGNTVDVAAATYQNTIGAIELKTVWEDPDFDADIAAFYYVRVIQIPTPRWTAFDVLRYGSEMPDDVEMITQERAYTSPIWYAP